jgi:simple sugar transport system substrate-binding protein
MIRKSLMMMGAIIAIAGIVSLLGGITVVPGTAGSPKWCEGVYIIFFPGGAPGDPFASVVYKGAKEAEEVLGPRVDYLWSEWESEKMVTQFKEAIGFKPTGIAMMGHPGYEALKDLVEEAYKQGIIVTFQNVDIPEFRAKYPYTGYVGQDLYAAGWKIAEWAVKNLGLKAGDRAAVLSGSWEMPARAVRARGSEDALKEAGLIVDRVSHPPAVYIDVALGIPIVTGYLAAHPDAKLLVFDGGGTTSAAGTYLKAAGKKPGEVFAVGFDFSPTTVEAIEEGYLQATIDQQPYLQGFLPILNICLSAKYMMAGLYIDTGGAIVHKGNVAPLKELVAKGYR